MQINTSQSSLNKYTNTLPSTYGVNTDVFSTLALLAAQTKASGNNFSNETLFSDLGLPDCPPPKSLILDLPGENPTDPNAPRNVLAGAGIARLASALAALISKIRGGFYRGHYWPSREAMGPFHTAGQPSQILIDLWRSKRIPMPVSGKDVPTGTVGVGMTWPSLKGPTGPNGNPYPPPGWRPIIKWDPITRTIRALESVDDGLGFESPFFNLNMQNLWTNTLDDLDDVILPLIPFLPPLQDPQIDPTQISFKCGCPDPLSKPIIDSENIPRDLIDSLINGLGDAQDALKASYINSVKSSDSYTALLGSLLEDTSISTKVKVNSYLGALDSAGAMLLESYPTGQVAERISSIIEGIKVVGFLGSELSFDKIQEKRQTLDLLNNEYQSALIDIDNSPALNMPAITEEDIKKALSNIKFVGEKQCLGDLVLNDQCDCVCPEGFIRCPENNSCIDCNNSNGGIVIIKTDSNGYRHCDCGCVDEKQISVMVGTTNICIDPCPEGTIFQWLDCDDPLASVTLQGVNENFINISKCYGCICCKQNQPPGIQHRIPCTKTNAFDCEGANQVRRGTDCECDCIEGYVKVMSPTNPDEFRCVEECPMGQVYIWNTGGCECRQLGRNSSNGTFADRVASGQECSDQPSKVWDNDLCACICPDGASYNVLADTCECPEGTVLLDGECVPEGSGSGNGDVPPDEGSGSGSGYGF